MSRRTQRNVGVIGLGIIGRRVADCLRHQRFATFVWNRTPRAFPNFVGSPTEVAELCDFIQIFVSDDDALLQVIQQMKQALGAHHIVMAHSTVAPGTMRAAAEIVQRRGGQLLDAPFTGSKLAAEKGELVYYIGGDDAAYRRARPILEASSKDIIEIGEIGQATAMKVATNMVTAATVQAAAEALALVHEAGLPLEKFAEAMQGNGSNSGTLNLKLPKMLSGDFDPHFSVKHMLKDVEIASRMARSAGLQIPATDAAREGLIEEAKQGHGDEDYCAVARAFFPDGPPGHPLADAVRDAPEQADFTLEERALAKELTPPEEPVVPEREIALPEAVERREEEPEPVMEEAIAERNGHIDEADKNGEAELQDRSEIIEPEAAVTDAEEAAEQPRDEVAERSEEFADEPIEVAPEESVSEARTEIVAAEEEPAAPTEERAEEVTAEPAQKESAVAEKEEEPRGFFARLFRKGADY